MRKFCIGTWGDRSPVWRAAVADAPAKVAQAYLASNKYATRMYILSSNSAQSGIISIVHRRSIILTYITYRVLHFI